MSEPPRASNCAAASKRSSEQSRTPPSERSKVPEAAVPLRVDLSGVAAEVSARLQRLETALAHVAEDRDVQAGAPTFRGTRVLVRPVAAALQRGVDRAEIKAD